jgi:hypothetical protein
MHGLLFGAEQSVAGVAETGYDVTVLVELLVKRRAVDMHVRMSGRDGFEPLRERR